MKRLTQSQRILNLLRQNSGWVKSYDLEKVNTDWGWIGSSGSRRARELAEALEIEVRHNGKFAEYRAKEPKGYEVYKVEGKEVAKVPVYQ